MTLPVPILFIDMEVSEGLPHAIINFSIHSSLELALHDYSYQLQEI